MPYFKRRKKCRTQDIAGNGTSQSADGKTMMVLIMWNVMMILWYYLIKDDTVWSNTVWKILVCTSMRRLIDVQTGRLKLCHPDTRSVLSASDCWYPAWYSSSVLLVQCIALRSWNHRQPVQTCRWWTGLHLLAVEVHLHCLQVDWDHQQTADLTDGFQIP